MPLQLSTQPFRIPCDTMICADARASFSLYMQQSAMTASPMHRLLRSELTCQSSAPAAAHAPKTFPRAHAVALRTQRSASNDAPYFGRQCCLGAGCSTTGMPSMLLASQGSQA